MLGVTHAAVAARFQLFPERLHLSKVDLVEGNGNLADGVIPAESVIIQHLQVQSALDHLLIWETWKINTHKAIFLFLTLHRLRINLQETLHSVISQC